jgi:hypothetical protein
LLPQNLDVIVLAIGLSRQHIRFVLFGNLLLCRATEAVLGAADIERAFGLLNVGIAEAARVTLCLALAAVHADVLGTVYFDKQSVACTAGGWLVRLSRETHSPCHIRKSHAWNSSQVCME